MNSITAKPRDRAERIARKARNRTGDAAAKVDSGIDTSIPAFLRRVSCST